MPIVTSSITGSCAGGAGMAWVGEGGTPAGAAAGASGPGCAAAVPTASITTSATVLALHRLIAGSMGGPPGSVNSGTSCSAGAARAVTAPAGVRSAITSLVMPCAVSSGDSGKLSWLTWRLIVVTISASARFAGKYVRDHTSIAHSLVWE